MKRIDWELLLPLLNGTYPNKKLHFLVTPCASPISKYPVTWLKKSNRFVIIVVRRLVVHDWYWSMLTAGNETAKLWEFSPYSTGSKFTSTPAHPSRCIIWTWGFVNGATALSGNYFNSNVQGMLMNSIFVTCSLTEESKIMKIFWNSARKNV